MNIKREKAEDAEDTEKKKVIMINYKIHVDLN